MESKEPILRKTSVAGGVVIGNSGTIVLVQRGGGDGAWLFPKGHIEPGENSEAAARREILEETGLTHLEYIDDLGVYERFGINKDGTENTHELKQIHMYLFAAFSTTLTPSHEIAAARWVSLAHVGNELGNIHDAVWFSRVFERVRQAIQRD